MMRLAAFAALLLCSTRATKPAPFDVADWFGGGCGRTTRTITVVETRFMQGQGQFPELVAARLHQLLAVAVPSLAHQTNQCFVWVLLTDPGLPDAPRRRIEQALRPLPHARLVDSPRKTDREAPNATLFEGAFGASRWRRAMRDAREFALVRLDADDGLHVDYLRLLADWRARHRGELSPTSTFAYACSSRSLNWKSAEAKRWEATSARERSRRASTSTPSTSGRTGAASRRASPWCTSSSTAPSRPARRGPAPRTTTSSGSSPSPVKTVVVNASSPSTPPPVFRVRSVTSNGGGNHEGGRADVSPAAVAADYGLSLVDLLGLTRYLKRHEAAVATEMLEASAARGCNAQYSGSCDKGGASAWAREVINVHGTPRAARTPRGATRRYADLVGTLCAGEVKFCDGMVLRRHYLEQGEAQGRLWGCGRPRALRRKKVS
ncbi:rhamnosyl transferase [Aureococcus anophagefferens]|nr:rhamnosyl transferase [Aureococcus anophagefferens]